MLEDYSDQGADSAPDAGSLPALPVNADGSPMSRGQMKEACRLAYCSGRHKLTELCVTYRLPYDTLRCWSREEGWSVTKAEVATQAHSGTVSAIADWLTEQRMEQMKRSVGRASRLQGAIDQCYPKDQEDKPLCPKDLQSIATAEERADLIIRRNLGLDQPGAGAPLVNVNALGSITFT